MKVGLISTGICKGEIQETNFELDKKVKNFDVSIAKCSLNEWLIKHYGIKSRLKSAKLPSEMAYKACLSAIESSALTITDIDFLILNTTTGDFKQPTTATKVQHLLGMKKNSFAIEVNMPCAGNLYGMAMASSFIKSGLGNYGLVVGVDKMSTNINQEDFILAGMFGDAAAAGVIGLNPKFEVLDILLKSKNDENGTLRMKSSGSAFPLSEQTVKDKEHLLKMRGNETKDFIKASIHEMFTGLLVKSGLKVADLDQLILHQASLPILKETCKELGLTESQAFFTVDKYGNTSSASVLLTLHEYMESKTNPGEHIFLIGMGSGLNWGGVYLRRRLQKI
jgi:3-oxoacyl-[acyl-carrier-protein] synthase-3